MGKVFEGLDEGLRAFIAEQHMFFVGTAPSGSEGLINVSPKGLDTFVVLDERTVAWLDLTGSGAETIAHLRDNGRICVMFCAFQGRPRILRLYGRGEVLLPDHEAFAGLAARFDDLPGKRSIIRVRCERIADSCGYAVPRYTYEGQRDQLMRWAESKGPEGLEAYRAERNASSLDGLPALDGLTSTKP